MSTENKELFKITITVNEKNVKGIVELVGADKIVEKDVFGALEMFKSQFILDVMKPSPKPKKSKKQTEQ